MLTTFGSSPSFGLALAVLVLSLLLFWLPGAEAQPASPWHVSTEMGAPSGGTYNAWAGCDTITTNPFCSDVQSWDNPEGYADGWNYALRIRCTGQDASAGGTIQFDLRYDTECVYDYAYLEYREDAPGASWQPVLDGTGVPAVFNGVSGNPVPGCNSGWGANYFDTGVLDGSGDPYHGNSAWYENVMFPLPAQSGITRIRWRAHSDLAWSDLDGGLDSDGVIAIDNVRITFDADGSVVTDDFESGHFGSPFASSGTAVWNLAPTGLDAPDPSVPVSGYAFSPPRPSPFEQWTAFRFQLPVAGEVSVVVYDVQGRRVRSLVDRVLDAGDHTAGWDGLDGEASSVASGTYFVRMTAGDFARTRQVILLR